MGQLFLGLMGNDKSRSSLGHDGQKLKKQSSTEGLLCVKLGHLFKKKSLKQDTCVCVAHGSVITWFSPRPKRKV